MAQELRQGETVGEEPEVEVALVLLEPCCPKARLGRLA